MALTKFVRKRLAAILALSFMIITGIPLLVPLLLPLPITPSVEIYYDSIEDLPSGSTIFVVMDGYSNKVTQLITTDTLKHIVSRGHKFVQFCSDPGGLAWAQIFPLTLIKPTLEEYNYVYGEDYAYIGYIPGLEIAMSGMYNDFQNIVKADYYGTPTAQVPLLASIIDHNSFDYAVIVSNADTLEAWSRQWPAGYPPKSLVISMQFLPSALPFMGTVYQAWITNVMEQAQYQVLLKLPGAAVKESDAWSVANLFLGLEVVAVNIWFLFLRKKEVKT